MSTTLTFIAPPPGLEPLVDFTLAEVDGAPGLHTLRATSNPDIRLFVIDAPVYLPWYVPKFEAESYQSVGGEDGADVLVVATLSEGSPIVNLMAPMLVNRQTGAASQVILGDEWPLRAQLTPPNAAA
jgi:flagellar assembly factor FliW